MKPLLFILAALTLTACGSSQKFSESDLKPSMYQGYWAMSPINELYRVVKFHHSGVVQVYDYSCDSEGYHLNETETLYLSKQKENVFSLLDAKKKPFARFEITRTSPQQFQAKEQFLDPKIEPRLLNLSYTNQVGAKPLCPMFY